MSFNDIKVEIMRTIRMMNDQAEEGDVCRNHVNYGYIQAFGVMLHSMGHRAELKNCYENDKGCLVMVSASIDGEAIW